jgi:hypothetical protein
MKDPRQLNLFHEHLFQKAGHWKPQIGEIVQVGFILGVRLPINTDPLKRLGCITVTFAYCQAINEKTGEVLVHTPFLKSTPWCTAQWFLTSLHSCHENHSYGFNSSSWREQNPENAFLGAIPWDSFNQISLSERIRIRELNKNQK